MLQHLSQTDGDLPTVIRLGVRIFGGARLIRHHMHILC